jgi:hypothetical protein
VIWFGVGFNAEGGWRTVRVGFDRVPIRGERLEFRDPEGGETKWDPELDGNTFVVEQVAWIAGAPGHKAEPLIFIVPKSEFEP